MSKQTPFFKFDAMQWLGGAIQNCTLEEKGLFIDICALYWKNYKPVEIDAKFKVRYRYLEGTLSNLIGTLSDLGFIEVFEAGIIVPFLDELMIERADFLEKCSKAGKKSKALEGRSSNKKEERRKKSVDSRKKIEDNTPNTPKGASLHDKVVSDIEWPESFDEDVKHIFLMFLGDRRESKKYVTDNAVKGLFGKLNGFTRQEQIDAINDAIAGGYQGLFPKKAYVGNSKTPIQNLGVLPTTEQLASQRGVISTEEQLDEAFKLENL